MCSNTNGDIELKGLNLFINTDIERKIEPNPHSLKYIFNTNVNRYVNKQLSKKSRNKEINKPFIPIFEIEYKKIKKV